MRAGAAAGRAILRFVRVGLGVSDEFGERVGRDVLACDQHARRIGHEADRREVSRGVIERLLIERLVLRQVGEPPNRKL